MNIDNFDTEKFILEIEKRPALWDGTSVTNGNREIRTQRWDELIDIFGGKHSTASERLDIGLLLQKKWKSIRGCFTRELRRQERLVSGIDPGPRKSEYMFFQHMQFLLKVVNCDKPRESSEGAPDCLYCGESEFSIKKEESDSEDPLREDSPRPKRAKYGNSLEENEDRMFLLSLLSTLQSVPQDRKLSTKIKLMSVLEEATK